MSDISDAPVPILHEGSRRELVLPPFPNSGWSMRMRWACGLVISLHWGDKAEATHELVIDKQALLQGIRAL